MLLNATCEIPASGNAIKGGFLEGKKAGCGVMFTSNSQLKSFGRAHGAPNMSCYSSRNSLVVSYLDEM